MQDDDFALKGPTSPLKGPDVSIISSFFGILACKSDKLIELCIVSLVGCFVDLFVIKGHKNHINRGCFLLILKIT